MTFTTTATFNLAFVEPTPFGPISLIQTAEIIKKTGGALVDATTLDNFDEVIAFACADSFSGTVGALASRSIATSIGDVKLDSLATKVSATSAYFGARGIFRAVEVALGLPRPLAVASSTVLAAVVSETFKGISRGKGFVLDKNEETESEKSESLDLPEISGDITKWLVYDAC